MGAFALSKLHVLITGAEASISRDAARLLASQGAHVLAADPDAKVLGRLARDVSLYGAQIETAVLNLASAPAIRVAEDHLRLTGRSPHVILCCCGRTGADCVGATAARVLQPSLFLQLAPRRRGPVAWAISSLRHPTLESLLARKPGRGVFDPNVSTPYVRIASQIYALQRTFDTAATDASAPETATRRRASAALVPYAARQRRLIFKDFSR